MKSYNSLKQFVSDYKMYRAAKKIDSGREGETITSYLKKKIDRKLTLASRHFKAMLKKRGYTMNDLVLIATHDSIRNVYSLESFVRECFGLSYTSPLHYKKVLSSNAFKSGRLKRLYEFIPPRIETKEEFTRFIKGRRDIPKSELTVLMSQLCKKNWRIWLCELVDKGKIVEQGGRWH